MKGSVIYSILTGAGLTNIFPVRAAQGTNPPFITHQFIDNVPTHEKDSTSKLDTVRVQINIIDNDYNNTETVRDSIRAALDGYRGTVDGVAIDAIWFEDENDLFFNETGDQGYYGKALDFKIREKL